MSEDRPFPKIELHVHLEATVRPADLFEMAKRNGFALPVTTVDELSELYRFRSFDHFLDLWIRTTPAIQTERDFRQVVIGYAREAASHGAAYIEGIFTPVERVRTGASWDEVFSGFCDGIIEARELTGLDVRLTTDIPRNLGLDVAFETVRYAAKYRERGIVGVGIGGPEGGFPPEPFAPAFQLAKGEGLSSVPHAGEAAGPASVRGAIDALGADRLRHGIRAVDDPGLLRELAARGIVCDVCPVSNLRTQVVPSLGSHPLPQMMEAGVLCSINTDDPAMFDTDLSREHEVAAMLGCSPRAAFEAGLHGARCDEQIRTKLQRVLSTHDWDTGTEI
jgi:aminodeoxyfutalosine deaminase